MFIFLINSLVLCWGNGFNSILTMKLAQLHYFSSQNVGGTNDIMFPAVQTLRGHVPPYPLKLGPCFWMICRLRSRLTFFFARSCKAFLRRFSFDFSLEWHARFLWIRGACNHKYTWWDRHLHFQWYFEPSFDSPGKETWASMRDDPTATSLLSTRNVNHCRLIWKTFVRRRSLSSVHCLKSNSK